MVFHFAHSSLMKTLGALNLTLSSVKSKMGRLNTFHFLGATFEAAQTTLDQNQVTVMLHNRSYRRALPGSRGVLPPPGPIRTVRASFLTYGSRIYKTALIAIRSSVCFRGLSESHQHNHHIGFFLDFFAFSRSDIRLLKYSW